MDKCWVQTSAGCPRHTQKCLPRLGTAEGRCGTSRSLEAGFVFADEWFVRHTSATYIVNVFVCFPRFTSHPDLFPQVHETNPHAPLHVQMSQELLFAENETLKLWSCTGHSFHFTASDLPSESTEGFGLVAFFDIVYPEGQIIFTFSLWFLLHNPAKHRDAPPEWRGGITQVCLWTIMI